MESSRLGLLLANCFDLCPFTLVNVKLVNVIESLLIGVNSSKYVDLISTYYCGVSISRLRRRTVCTMNFIPVIGQETVLENIIHSIMAIPASKDKHGVLKDYSRMSKPVERLYSVTLYLFPLVLLILDAALVHVSKSLLAIIAAVNKQSTIPEHHSMISPLTWHLTGLKCSHIKPFLLLQIIIEKIFVEIP